MREILFLSHRFPFPPDRGDKIRSWHILKALAEIAPVHLCTLVDNPSDLQHRPTVEAICASVTSAAPDRSQTGAMARALITGESASVTALASRTIHDAVARLLASGSVASIFAFSGQMAQFVPERLDGIRFVMDFVDVDSAKFQTYADQKSGLAALANRVEAGRLAAFERHVARRADLSLFVSEAEAALFRSRTGLGPAKVTALENGIDLARFDPTIGFAPVPGAGPLIVFTGQMDYRPNIDAVSAFARETMPLIRTRHGDARFAIVGRAPTEEVKALASLPGVAVTGEVADTREWLAAADVVVAPLTLARGIQNKVLEAMAMARPVVASPAAAEGIEVPADALCVAEGAIASSAAVCDLIARPDAAQSMGRAARAAMASRYGWNARLAALPGLIFPDLPLKACA